MDRAGGAKAIENLTTAGNTHSKLYTVKNAGHHGEQTLPLLWRMLSNLCLCETVFLDNPAAVNRMLVKELDRASR
jgi:hypothetical protein